MQLCSKFTPYSSSLQLIIMFAKKVIIFLFALFAFIGMASALPTGCEEPSTPPPPCEEEPLGGSNEEAVCNHGDYTCLGNDSAVCNWGQWVVTECGEGTRCLPYDWECVRVEEWDAWLERVSPTQSA